MAKHVKDGGGDVDVLLNKSAKQLRGAAKACRINKGGVACAVLDLAAAVVDNAQVLSTLVGGAAGMSGQALPTAPAASAPATSKGTPVPAATSSESSTQLAGDDERAPVPADAEPSDVG